MIEFTRKERAAAVLAASSDLYTFARWMFLQRRGYQWIRGQHHRVLCDALMRVFNGECKRLIINIPPRYSKTELAVVNFMSWCLGKVPDAEFIHTSYSGRLAANNAWQARELVASSEYREIFPDTLLRGDSAAKDEWRTTKGGIVYAVGAGGTITGYGAGKHRPGFGGCFPHEQQVETEHGPRSIGEIVGSGQPVRVWSFNEQTHRRELRAVRRFWRNPANHVIEVGLSDGSTFRCTPDHEVLTAAGWTSAIHLAKALDLVQGEAGHGRGLFAGEPPVDCDLHDAFRVLWLCVPVGIRKRLRDACPGLAQLDLSDDAAVDGVSSGELCGAFRALENGRNLIARELGAGAAFEHRERAVPERVLHVVGLAAIREIGERVVRGVAVEVPNLLAGGAWAYELLSNQMGDVAGADLATDGEVDAEVSLPVARRFKRSNGHCPADLAAVGHLVQAGGSGDRTPVAIRYVGHVDETFCLEVEGNHNFILSQSGAIVSNCILIDDPHKADEARSDVIRQGVIEWFQNTLESRKNDPKNTPIIVIMQRLHEADLSGWLLAGGNGEDWEHVCLPAITEQGEALWPEKHDIDELRRMQAASPYTFAGQYQQSPSTPEGNVIKPDQLQIIDALPASGIHWVRAWDLASTAPKHGTDPDWTVGKKWGKDNAGAFYIADVVRMRGTPDEVEATIVNTAARDGKAVRISIPQDPGQAGKSQILYLSKKLAGYRVTSSPETGDKITRAEPMAAQINVGNVRMLKAPWNDALVSEMRVFPNGTHDDQVDAGSRAFNELTAKAGPMLISDNLLRQV